MCDLSTTTRYHEASKLVKPRLDALTGAEGKLRGALADQAEAEAQLAACAASLSLLEADLAAA